MKRTLLISILLCGFLVLMWHTGCKTAEDAQYVLTVTVASGITGTPATGSYTHTDGDLVNYSFAVQTGYENLQVQLDGITVGNSGVVTMNMNHTLNVTVDQIFDPNGDWEGTWVWGTADGLLSVTFSGGYYSGTTLGDFGGYSNGEGTYSVTGDQIAFDLNWGALDGHFWGTINDSNNMSGTWESYSGSSTGTWSMERQ